MEYVPYFILGILVVGCILVEVALTTKELATEEISMDYDIYKTIEKQNLRRDIMAVIVVIAVLLVSGLSYAYNGFGSF